MEVLAQLFAARLVMNEDRNKAMELAQGDLLLGKVNIQIQDEIKKLEKPIDIQPEPVQPEQAAQPLANSKFDASYQEIVEKIMSNYGPVGQKILIEINKQLKG